MSLPLDDEQILFDQFVSEETVSAEKTAEDNPLAAFAAEQAPDSRVLSAGPFTGSTVPEIDESALHVTCTPAPNRVAPQLIAPIALAAAVLAIAAGAYVNRATPVSEDERVAHTPISDVRISTSGEATVDGRGDERINRHTPPAAAAAASAGSPALAGDWMMNTRVESSRLRRYEGLRLGYRVSLRQSGDRISGTGWKVSEGERAIGRTSQTPIAFDGVMKGDRVELAFTEQGRLRPSAGTLVLARDSDNSLRGRFSTSAAQSLGVVEMHR